MAETDEDELTRLVLLSNTATLKKLMDKDGDVKKEETKAKAALAVSMPRPRLEESSSEREGENSFPSPHWGMDSVHIRSNFRFASIPTQPYGFNTARDNSQCSSQQAEGGTYAFNWSEFYGRNTREILYSPDRIHSPQHMMPARPQYSMKENLPPCRYLDSSTYSDSAGVGIQASGISQTFHPTGGNPISSKSFSQLSPPSSYDSIIAQNHRLHEQLQERDFQVSSLQQRVNHLENKIIELRQLPTGKVSHIPIDDMVKIMLDYGSEVSDQTLPMRKEHIKKTSIIRQFRRWNPTFFNYFVHANGEWVPKLGKEGELRRREEKRKMMKKRQG
jgi:hypothetical protein